MYLQGVLRDDTGKPHIGQHNEPLLVLVYKQRPALTIERDKIGYSVHVDK